MIPVVPVLFLMAALALWQRYKEKGYILKSRKLMMTMAGITLLINFVLLVPLTTAYGHKGLIEPLLWIENMDEKPRVMFVQPDMKRWIPINYAGYEPPARQYIRKWETLQSLPANYRREGAFNLFVLYPQQEGDREIYLDSLQGIYGRLELVRSFESSFYDDLMHGLNPGYYNRFEPLVYKPADR